MPAGGAAPKLKPIAGALPSFCGSDCDSPALGSGVVYIYICIYMCIQIHIYVYIYGLYIYTYMVEGALPSFCGSDCDSPARKVDVRLPGKGISNSLGARPFHLIITMIKWIRTIRMSIKNSL